MPDGMKRTTFVLETARARYTWLASPPCRRGCDVPAYLDARVKFKDAQGGGELTNHWHDCPRRPEKLLGDLLTFPRIVMGMTWQEYVASEHGNQAAGELLSWLRKHDVEPPL